MQPPSTINPTNNKTHLTQDHRALLCQFLNDLDDDQLRVLLTNYLTNSANSHQFQHYTRLQLFQQSVILIDNYYSVELEQTIHTMRQKHFPSDFYLQQQQQANFPISFNQQSYRYNTSGFRFPPPPPQPPTPAISQQLRSIRPNINNPRLTNAQNAGRQASPQQSTYFTHQQQHRHPPPSSALISDTSPTLGTQRYQVPILPSSSHTSTPTSASSTSALPSTSASSRLPINKIAHKTLPFYRPLACVHERYHIFHYDQYRKQHTSLDEFLLPLDVCNQLALSYDYEPALNIHKTSKCLLLRLARIDQPPGYNGTYDDNLPPNLTLQVNGHPVANLPIPKACVRQQSDLIRAGREVDITSHCMFNPMLKNEIKINWSCRQENSNLYLQYANAQYALHVFLVDHLTVDYLCEQIKKKPMRFFRDDLVKLLAKARANDRDLGLEVSDQKLKLTCPIDQRRMKIPIRATTCRHLQCFDLTNYIALNEKSNKWTCPVCNKYALFEELQIDTYTESILNSIPNEDITEIIVNNDFFWTPVPPSKTVDQPTNIQSKFQSSSSSADFILIDDD